MQKKILLIIINLLLLTNSYATSKQDSVYHDLYQFLLSMGDLPKGMDWVLECENCECKKYLYVFDILKDEFPNQPDFIDIPFGIYKFNYNGCMDCGYYVLIKHNESYKVFYQNALPLIIKELLQIKRKYPELIPDELFYNYLSELIKVDLGINTSNVLIMRKIGKIEYYMSR